MPIANDRFPTNAGGIGDPGWDAIAVTPSDGSNLSQAARALYVGGTGDVTLITAAGNSVLFQSVPAGFILPVRCTKVMSTGTTATKITAFT